MPWPRNTASPDPDSDPDPLQVGLTPPSSLEPAWFPAPERSSPCPGAQDPCAGDASMPQVGLHGQGRHRPCGAEMSRPWRRPQPYGATCPLPAEKPPAESLSLPPTCVPTGPVSRDPVPCPIPSRGRRSSPGKALRPRAGPRCSPGGEGQRPPAPPSLPPRCPQGHGPSPERGAGRTEPRAPLPSALALAAPDGCHPFPSLQGFPPQRHPSAPHILPRLSW